MGNVTGNKVGITFVVMCAALMALVDITIVNVALNDIRASFGTPIDQIGWVSTGYMMANIVIIPMTGWFQRRFGFMRADERGGAAVSAHQPPLLRKRGEVAPHRRFRYPQLRAQLFDVGVAGENEIKDGAVAFGCFHGLVAAGRGRRWYNTGLVPQARRVANSAPWRKASSRLRSSAIPLPAMSNAVP